VVSKNADTLHGLATYLRDSGVSTASTRQVEASVDLADGSTAIVVFPDDFDWDMAVSALIRCQRKHPGVLVVLVTRSPRSFKSVAWPQSGTPPVLVPKPAWGWKILDAIRAHVDPETGDLSR